MLILGTLLSLGLASAQANRPNVFAGAPMNDIKVSVDNVVQCGKATISWSGTTVSVSPCSQLLHVLALCVSMVGTESRWIGASRRAQAGGGRRAGRSEVAGNRNPSPVGWARDSAIVR